MIRSALLLCLFALVGFRSAAQNDVPDFRLEVGDQIAISVLEDPSLNTTVLIRPDGFVSLPLVGTVRAAGRTPESVQATIRRQLTDSFLAPPSVTVSLVGLGGRERDTFYMLGEVGRPGPYDLTPGLNILQALALAGGPGRFAATNRIQIRREDEASGRQTLLLFDYDGVTDGALPTDLIGVQAGDVIVLPVRGLFE